MRISIAYLETVLNSGFISSLLSVCMYLLVFMVSIVPWDYNDRLQQCDKGRER